MFSNHAAPDLHIFGGEMSVRFHPSESLEFLATWAYRESFSLIEGSRKSRDNDPKNFFTLGGRFLTQRGLLGSLYVFTRSEFWIRSYDFTGTFPEQHMNHVFLILGKLGWKWQLRDTTIMETGLKLLLPVSPFESPNFRYRDFTAGVELTRMLTVYVQGSF
jgi:hypothetical protein